VKVQDQISEALLDDHPSLEHTHENLWLDLGKLVAGGLSRSSSCSYAIDGERRAERVSMLVEGLVSTTLWNVDKEMHVL
jgi:hypothetical protein